MIYIIRLSKSHRKSYLPRIHYVSNPKIENDFSRTIKPVIIHVAIVSDNFRCMAY